jgi:hypothetical protein
MGKDKLRVVAAGAVLAAVAVTAASAAGGTVAATGAPPRPHPTPTPTPSTSSPAPARQPANTAPPNRDVVLEPPGGQVGVPEVALRAYRTAEAWTARSRPNCHLSWSLVAAIGRVESNHARGGQVDGAGTTVTPIVGPQLSGNGYAAVADTDNGALDGDPVWDHAVGPMQFIPSTWRRNGVDANADGVASPHNIFDAAAAAGRYLCAQGRDLSDPARLREAVFGYNPSESYVDMVLAWQRAYAAGVSVLPGGLPPAAVAVPVPPPSPAPTPTPTPTPPPDDQVTPPAEDPPASEQCLLDLSEAGVPTEELLGVATEVACQEHLLKLGPLRIDELPTLDLALPG